MKRARLRGSGHGMEHWRIDLEKNGLGTGFALWRQAPCPLPEALEWNGLRKALYEFYDLHVRMAPGSSERKMFGAMEQGPRQLAEFLEKRFEEGGLESLRLCGFHGRAFDALRQKAPRQAYALACALPFHPNSGLWQMLCAVGAIGLFAQGSLELSEGLWAGIRANRDPLARAMEHGSEKAEAGWLGAEFENYGHAGSDRFGIEPRPGPGPLEAWSLVEALELRESMAPGRGAKARPPGL